MNSKNLLKKSQIEFNEIHAKVSMILSRLLFTDTEAGKDRTQ